MLFIDAQSSIIQYRTAEKRSASVGMYKVKDLLKHHLKKSLKSVIYQILIKFMIFKAMKDVISFFLNAVFFSKF